MTGNVWVLVEHWRGKVSDISYELLALGREVADALGVKLEAVLLGSQVRGAGGDARQSGCGALRRSSRRWRSRCTRLTRRRWRRWRPREDRESCWFRSPM